MKSKQGRKSQFDSAKHIYGHLFQLVWLEFDHLLSFSFNIQILETELCNKILPCHSKASDRSYNRGCPSGAIFFVLIISETKRFLSIYRWAPISKPQNKQKRMLLTYYEIYRVTPLSEDGNPNTAQHQCRFQNNYS